MALLPNDGQQGFGEYAGFGGFRRQELDSKSQ
jgi:hypothetical protein